MLVEDLALTKGANVALFDGSDMAVGQLQVLVRWSDPTATADVDVSALLLGPDGRVRSDDDLVFYNAPTGGDGAVRLLGKRTDESSGEDRVAVDLEALPADVDRVVVVASLDADPGAGFGDLKTLELVLQAATGQPMVRYDVADAGSETAMAVGELYRRHEGWKFRAVGQGWESGLAGLATDFGIAVADDTPTTTGGDVAIPDAIQPEALPQPPVNRPAVPSTGARGVRTRKKRTTGSALPAMALADDPGWQAARLFSISGVGTADEQEKRATSALLSSMMAVRDFGRALVSRFGGPAGSIETYLEVPFTIDERTVYPDGVIKVVRAGRVWTALLETKTGPSPLRAEQIDRYLDVAKQHSYDAVITLSNDIAPVGGTHPVPVDGRKLRKVALHHISWSEVLHEAQMQLAHRGVEDRLQAWLLAELIRYLEHPRSGAAGFDDMGASWVPVREAVAAGTLRATDRKIGPVALSWEKLSRHLSLRLTSQLGVTVAAVVARKTAHDHEARLNAAVARLATDGTLQASFRIPGSAGPLAVVADLRTSQVRTSVEIDAPREGGSARRVNWVLRQLADSPDSLLVEVLFARREQTSCELLKDVRSNSAALLPDPAAEVRAFRLTLTSPLGTKRNGLRRAFIPSVNAAVDAFYAQVVQCLRPWPTTAPKLPTDVAEAAIEAAEIPL